MASSALINGYIFLAIGVAIVVIAWAYFRKEGISFWQRNASIRNAGSFLKAPGIALWYASFPMMAAAAASMLFYLYKQPG